MNKLIPCIAIILASSTPAWAAGVFDGTWKGDMKASKPSDKPSVILLDGGKYSCSTCQPAIAIAADGADHPVAGNPYYDQLAVAVVDPATIKRTMHRGGKLVAESTSTVSADGTTMTTAFNDMTAGTETPVTGTTISDRVAAGPAGSHAISGSWRSTMNGQVSDSGLTFTMLQTGRSVHYSSPTGVTYTATIGGGAAPVAGDPGWTAVKLRQTAPNILVETDMHEGKPIAVYTMTISPDGKTLTAAVNDLKFKTTATMVATKQ